MATSTANMGLTVPSSGDSDYPTSISDSLTAVDEHDHSSGKGIQIPSSGIVDAAITENKIADSAVATAKIANQAVTTGKIANQAVGTSQLANSSVVEAIIANSAVTTAKIADSNVTTAKIADTNVTPAKLASTNVVSSSSSGSVTYSGAGPAVDVPNLNLNITGRGRLILIFLSRGGSNPFLYSDGGNLYLLRNGSVYQSWPIIGTHPQSAIWAISPEPTPATVNWKIQADVTASSMIITDLQLNAFEVF
jgi:hypothetical protein